MPARGLYGDEATALKMATKNFLPGCIVFFNRIPVESSGTRN